MSYEYKYQSRLEDIVDDNVTEVDEQIFILDEIGYVYAQAAKADEYEAKAKAFDGIVEKYEGVMKGVRNRKFKVVSDVTLLGLEAEKVINKYESGEYDAKK